jgi:hypothetical protein
MPVVLALSIGVAETHRPGGGLGASRVDRVSISTANEE